MLFPQVFYILYTNICADDLVSLLVLSIADNEQLSASRLSGITRKLGIFDVIACGQGQWPGLRLLCLNQFMSCIPWDAKCISTRKWHNDKKRSFINQCYNSLAVGQINSRVFILWLLHMNLKSRWMNQNSWHNFYQLQPIRFNAIQPKNLGTHLPLLYTYFLKRLS